MEFTQAELLRTVNSLIWPFLRVSAFFLAAPIFGARSVSVRVRVALALMIAWALAPLVDAPAISALSAVGLLISAQQIALGLGMGFIFQLAFSAVVIAGQNIAMTMGLGFASALDPQNGVQVPVVSQLYLIFATLLFLAIDGHLLFVQGLHESFTLLPLGAPWPQDLPWVLSLWAGRMFAAGLLIALPALAGLLLVNIAFGVVTRAAPQLNIFAVGFPVTLLVGFLLIMLSLPTYAPLFSALLSDTFATALAMLEP